MQYSIRPQLVAALFLKYVAIQPPEILAYQMLGGEPIKLWFCNFTGAPSMGSGELIDVPIDAPIAYVYADPQWNIKLNTTHTSDDQLDVILNGVAAQLKCQYDDFKLAPNSLAAIFANEVIEGDPELSEIADTFFSANNSFTH